MKDLLRRILPFELKRDTSRISIVLALIVAGILAKVGDLIATFSLEIVSKLLPLLGAKLFSFLFFKFEINVLSIFLGAIIFLLVLFPIYRYFDRLFLQKRNGELIYQDKFQNNAGWHLNYWGTIDPLKTNRIENSQMIFEAIRGEIVNKDGHFGAFYDLRNGIYSGNTYRVICMVKSMDNATMGFQLWVHDVAGHSDKFMPEQPIIPPERGKEIDLEFKATSTNALRIHLHCRGGSGKIVVEYVRVYKI
jgi:hypothetical protein